MYSIRDWSCLDLVFYDLTAACIANASYIPAYIIKFINSLLVENQTCRHILEI